MQVHLIGRVATHDTQLDTAIGAVSILNLNNNHVLLTASAGAGADMQDPTAPQNGGVAIYDLSANGMATLLDSHHFQSGLTVPQIASVAPFAQSSSGVSIAIGANMTGPLAFEIASSGSIIPIAPPSSLASLTGVGPLIGTQDAMHFAGQTLDGQVALFDFSTPDTPLTTSLGAATSALAFGPVTSAGQSLLGISETGNTIILWRPSGPTVSLGMEDGLGIAEPTDIETINAYAQTFAIAASAGSGSLSVLAVDSTGHLRTLDHVIDTRSTRFADVQDIAVAHVRERVFVFAAGSDHGISMFNLLPDGRLVHLDSLANGPVGGLSGIHRLSVFTTPDGVHVYAATQDTPGLTHLSVPVASIGELLADGFEQIGTPRDDILIAGPDGARLTGGEGRDVFVLHRDGGDVHITDFTPADDTLDLSDFAMLRDPGQLSILETDTGARITYRDAVITLDSFDAAPLGGDALFGMAFDWPDRIAYFPSATTPDEADTDKGGDDADPPQNTRLSWLEITLTPSHPNSAIEGASLSFRSDDGTFQDVPVDQTGRFDLSGLSGETGWLSIGRPYSQNDPDIGVADALDILRIAVGLNPTSGPTTIDDLAAADFDGNGTASVSDALDVLRFAIGIGPPPEWRFVDAQSNIEQAVEAGTPLHLGLGADFSAGVPETLDVIAILPGSIDGWS